MGWCCGHGMSSTRDVARFYYDLLGPEAKIVSEENRQVMQNWTMCDYGWSANLLYYGGGLMIQWLQNEKGPAHLGRNSTFIGHGGETYGFSSQQGYFESLKTSMSIASN